VIKQISTGITVCEWEKFKQNWDHLRDIPFHAVGRNDGIDILIGANFIRLHRAIREVRGNGNDPVARLTPLGWTCV